MNEIELINRCIQKDALAWNEFVRRYSGLVYWAIENRLKRWDYFYKIEDIEEIHQNVFLSLWKKNKLEQIKDQKRLTTWLVIISGNETVDYLRLQKSQTPPKAISLFEEIIKKGKAICVADVLKINEADARAKIKSEEIEKILSEEIERLSAAERLILKLNVLYGKKYREIAEIINMPIGTVSTTLKNIKQTLKGRLKEKI
ncbi:MAG: sigma-70 family RNA polymerase sigma factor [Candidatus Omnitrophica bacterium]|nr:sigma-70 family RNA polymerase sigma factor [Candidatus Omnitrophota bacterium]